MKKSRKKRKLPPHLGELVTVVVTNPIGSVHKDRPDVTYTANFGYASGDVKEEKLGAYILGIDTPVSEFYGRVIAVIHREEENSDILVTAPEGVILDQAEVAEATDFCEKFYTTAVEPLYHRSCGAVLFRRTPHGIEYLLLYQQASCSWSFPKGHAEAGETEEETVIREVEEEAGFTPTLINGFREEIVYSLLPIGVKRVSFFLSEYNGEVTISGSEIKSYVWTDQKGAMKLLWYNDSADLIAKAEEFISEKL